MKPRNVAFITGVLGLIIGVLLFSDVPGAPIFFMAVFGFLGFECTWALGHIGKTKKISKDLEKKSRKSDKAKKKGPK